MDALLYEKIERYISKHRTADGARHLRMLCGCYDLDTIEDAIANAKESFSEMLFRLIREKGISEVECYKRAGISRPLPLAEGDSRASGNSRIRPIPF